MKARIAALLLGTSLIYGQNVPKNFPSSIGEPPMSAPSGCSGSVMTMSNMEGTQAYRFMRREVAAFALGHDANHKVQAALAVDTKASPMHQMLSSMMNLTDAQNNYLCASFILGQEVAKTDDDKTLRLMTVSVYNRLALGTSQLQERLKKVAEDDEAKRPISNVKVAEDIATIL